MIIFYHKKTGEIIGTIEGRVHSEEHLRMSIHPSNIPKKDIGRYIIPFKPKSKAETIPVKEWRTIDKKTMKTEQVIMKEEKIEVPGGIEPDVPYANLILDFESGKEKIFDYKIKLGKDGKIKGFEKK